jgi:hypothetical protein
VLVLSVDRGILGSGGTSAFARVAPVRRTPEVAASCVLSRMLPPDAAFARIVAVEVCLEDTEVVRVDAGAREAGDGAGEVDAFVRWRGAEVAGLRFAGLFGADAVRARALAR